MSASPPQRIGPPRPVQPPAGGPTPGAPPAPRAIPLPQALPAPVIRPAGPPVGAPQPAQQAAPAAQPGRFAWVRDFWPFGRQSAQVQPRPGQPGARPAGPAAIPATVTLTVTVQSGLEGHRTPVKDATVIVNDTVPEKLHVTGTQGSVTIANIATGGKPIRIKVSHPKFIDGSATVRPERAVVAEVVVLAPKWVLSMAWVFAAVGLLALIPIVVGIFTSAPIAPSAPITIQPPPMPQIQPIDLASAAWIGPVQGMLLTLGVLLIGLALLDRWLVKQIHDVTVPAACVIALYVINWAPIRAALATPPFNFTDQHTIGWLVIVSSVVAVYAVVRLPTPDYTASALYSGLLVVAGLTVGSLGLMQVAFGISEAPVVSMGQMIRLLQHKEWAAIQFSLLIYALCVVAIGFYGWESVKPTQKDGKPSWGGPVLAVLGLVVYYAASRGMIRAGFISDPDWAWLYYAMALLMTLVANWIGATLAKEVLTGEIVATSHSYTDVRLGFLTIRTPWDVIGLEVMMGIFLILMFGTI